MALFLRSHWKAIGYVVNVPTREWTLSNVDCSFSGDAGNDVQGSI